MKITVISVGILKEKYLVDAVLEYSKRLTKYVDYEEIVIKDESNSDKINQLIVKEKEGKKILEKINPKSYVIALDIKGQSISSKQLASKFLEVFSYHASHITFVIGGSFGLYDEVLNISNYKLSFSKMTFPHQLMKVILLEQIYRAFKINNNEVYHK